jgi:hypothetical protein
LNFVTIMNCSSFFLPLLALALAPPRATAQFIDIRVSIKVIVDPVTGNRPSGITDVLLRTAETNANVWKLNYSRGYKFRIAEIVNIGGPSQGGSSGPSQWYGQDPRATPEPWNTFQNDINTDSRYQRRTDQVNFYITTSPSSNPGGACPIPPGEPGNISCHGFVNGGPWWMNHELGHFFGLYHTFGGCSCGGCSYPSSGDDGISETLPEASCDTQDQIALRAFAKTYSNCTASEKNQVDNTFFNVMSYHNAATKDQVEDRMTELQLDRVSDMANSTRRPFVSGETVYVSLAGLDIFSGRSSGGPKRTVANAVASASASGSDIVLLRPGSYGENITINRAVTLRATRVGSATIGTP